MSQQVQKYWEDFEVGWSFKTMSVTVTETHIVNWACLTGDFYMLHMDAEYASKTVFGERVAHGPLIFGMSVGMVAMANVEGKAVSAWMGDDNMRMLGPVRIGDTITVEVTVVDRQETKKPHQGLQTWRYSIKNQRDEVVMTHDMKFMMHRRPQAS